MPKTLRHLEVFGGTRDLMPVPMPKAPERITSMTRRKSLLFGFAGYL
jgi:hypothetical protein